MRAVGFFRRPPGEDGHVPSYADTQRFTEFCQRQGLEPATTFTSPIAEPEGAGFRNLLEYVRAGQGGMVVVIDGIDALGADAREAARKYYQLTGMGARVVCIDGSDPDAQLLNRWSVRASRERVGERVRDAMRRKAVKGEVLGRPPYGYAVGDRHRLEVIPDEAAVVRRIFRLYLTENLGIRLIARRLNEEGYRTRRGGNWSMVTIRDILRNRAYLGTYARFGVRVPGSHAAIITQDEFRRAGERLAARRTGGGPRNVSPFLLSGFAYCGSCGNRMIGVSRRQQWQRRSDGGISSAEYRYYQCGSRTNQSVCSYHTRRVDELDEQVRRSLVEALLQPLPAPDTPEPLDRAASARERLLSRLRSIDRDFDRVLDQGAAGAISPDRLRQLSIDLARRRLQVEDQLGEAERQARRREAVVETRALREATAQRLQGEWDRLTFEERQELLQDVLDRAIIHDGRVQIVLEEQVPPA